MRTGLTTPAGVLPSRSDAEQRRLNERVWRDGNHLKTYANRRLRPVEVVLLVRYREILAGSILELGCGAGRLTGYLLEISRAVVGIDLSPAMIDYCRRRYPGGGFAVLDLRDLGRLEQRSFDVVVAPFNVLDVLDDAGRGSVLDEIHELLAPGGLLIMSSHNRDHADHAPGPFKLRHLSLRGYVGTLVRLPRWLRNRRRAVGFERDEPDYAILNDSSVDFSLLHYYISREAQERQFAAHGFSLIECLDLDGASVSPGSSTKDCPELHYVACRSEGSLPPVPIKAGS